GRRCPGSVRPLAVVPAVLRRQVDLCRPTHRRPAARGARM
ncbi:MAG: hypothetical protein AVDCRST_MAG16-328, partial [uncultured Frankineae bacterium]